MSPSSTTSRIISGSLGSWAQIGVRFVTQLLLVPVYLSYWEPELYGIWLSVQAAVHIYQMLDFGHAEFLGFEFLKIGQNDREDLRLQLWSGMGIAIVLSLVEILIISGVVYFEMLHKVFGTLSVGGRNLSGDVGIVFLLLYIAWVFNGYYGGIIQRALYPYGYFPRTNWWGFVYSMVTAFAPVVAVVTGGGLLRAGLVLAFADIAASIIYHIDLFLLLKKEDLLFRDAKLSVGIRGFIRSLMISTKSLLEKLHQQGARVILAPLSGGAGVAAFSTMRTGANVFLQGLSTITSPLMPELMRFLNQKDQERTEVAFAMVWVVIIIFAPAVIMLQIFIEPLYNLWTRGSLSFNPLLFAILSQGVLVYGLAQPAKAVVKGNNILKPQLVISAVAGLIIVGGMFLMVPIWGVLGAGIALLGSEVVSLLGYYYITMRWLHSEGMKWPLHSFSLAALAVGITAIALGLIVWIPEFKWITVTISISVLIWNIKWYWSSLPDLASVHAYRLVEKIPIFKNIIKTPISDENN